MCQLEMVGEEGAFVLGWDEVLTEEELSMTLKVRMARRAAKGSTECSWANQQCRMAQ